MNYIVKVMNRFKGSDLVDRVLDELWTMVLDIVHGKSILKKINPEYSLEGLTLKLQYFGHKVLKSRLIG